MPVCMHTRESSITSEIYFSPISDCQIYDQNLNKRQAIVFMVWDFPFSLKTSGLKCVLNYCNLCSLIKSTLELITGRCNCD